MLKMTAFLRTRPLTAALFCLCSYAIGGQVNPITTSQQEKTIEIKKQSLPVTVDVTAVPGLTDYLDLGEQIADITVTGNNSRTTRFGLRLSDDQENQQADLQSPVLAKLMEVEIPGNYLFIELKLTGGEIITDKATGKQWIVSKDSAEQITATVVKRDKTQTMEGTYHLHVDGIEWSE